MDYKEALGLLAAIIGIAGYVPYFIGIRKGTTHPHIFSWLLWGLLTGIGFALQVTGEAGPGAWVTGISTVLTLTVAACAFKVGEKTITRSDWVAFIGALTAIPLWLATDNPLMAAILITVIDAVSFWPTFRKSWMKPHEEVLTEYVTSAMKFSIGLAAIPQLSLVNGLYTASLVFMNAAFVIMALLRRRALTSK